MTPWVAGELAASPARPEGTAYGGAARTCYCTWTDKVADRPGFTQYRRIL